MSQRVGSGMGGGFPGGIDPREMYPGGFGGGRGVLPGEMDFGRPPMRQPYFPPRQQPMPPGYRNPYAPSPFYQQRFDRYAPMMPQGGGGGRYGNQNMGSIWGGGMGQVIPTNIPFRDQGYGSPMLSQNLIQSLSGPNNLMNPYRRDTTLDMLGRFRGGGGGWGGGWGGMRNDPYYDRWGGGGYPPAYDDGGGYPPGRGGGGKGGRGGGGNVPSPENGAPPPETGNGAPPPETGNGAPPTDKVTWTNSETGQTWLAEPGWTPPDGWGPNWTSGSEQSTEQTFSTERPADARYGVGHEGKNLSEADVNYLRNQGVTIQADGSVSPADFKAWADTRGGVRQHPEIQRRMDERGWSVEQAERHNASAVKQGADLDGDGYVTKAEWKEHRASNQPSAGNNGQAAGNGQATTNTNNSNSYNFPPAALAALEAAGIDPATLNPADFAQGIGSMAGGGQVGAAQHMRKIPPPIAQRNLPADLARLQARAGHLSRRPQPNLRRMLDQLDLRRV